VPIYNGFTHWFLRSKARAIVTVAQHGADWLVGHGVDAGKITVVHNGIPDYRPDQERYCSIRSEWGLSDEHLVIGVASRLDPIKGLEYLLEALADLAGHDPSVRLVLIGEGPARRSLELRAEELGIASQVYFGGMRSDVPDCLPAFDVFALPSLSEFHSIGLLEAMRAGLAIVATDVGGNRESLLDQREGLIVPPGDTRALTDALQRLVDDAQLRQRFGRAARQRFVADFTESAMLHKTALWLQQSCGG
jgi:glycosyltransferase involved in cell wall biosynthesis